MAGLELTGPLALDANCLSYLFLQAEPARRSKMRAALREASEFRVVFSTVVACEVMVAPARRGNMDDLDALYAVLAQTDLFEAVPLSMEVAHLAARIRGGSSLKLPDAIVVATAVHAGASLLLSNDRQLITVGAAYLRTMYFDDWHP